MRGFVAESSQERGDVRNAERNGESFEHRFVVWGVTNEGIVLRAILEVSPIDVRDITFRHGKFIVVAKPTVHMDGADLGDGAVPVEHGDDFFDGLIGEPLDIFTEIDGEIIFSISLV